MNRLELSEWAVVAFFAALLLLVLSFPRPLLVPNDTIGPPPPGRCYGELAP